MKNSKRKIDDGQIFEKAANLWPYTRKKLRKSFPFYPEYNLAINIGGKVLKNYIPRGIFNQFAEFRNLKPNFFLFPII